ncbi:hypothetical protein LTR36_010763 [Oleoguttula mirabilis]|uniref:Uncharacterized protein n=1 Tax=Oleoguttula mirabilis TaxID=1507867 RepID=A0AAV9JSM3_9PEZI|nr:hypothetical protein LTR36_010763 [Oleoguttula mirabilis]
MASLKRKASDGQGPIRKSSRKSLPPARLAFQVSQNQPLPLEQHPMLSNGNVDFTPINELLKRHNNSLQFIGQQAGSAQKHNRAVQKAKERIDHILDKAIEDANAQCRILSRASHHLWDLAASEPHWYAHGSLVSLEYEHMADMLREHPIQDGAHFLRYLRSDLPEALGRWSQQNLRSPRLREKLRLLLKMLLELPNGWYMCFQFSVFVKAEVLHRYTPQIWNRELSAITTDLLTQIESILHRKQTHGAREKYYPAFYDCAALKRELWTVWSHACFPTSGSRQRDCVHVKNVDLLETLQEQAQKEVRANVVLATGCDLPAELAELVYEATLQAEDIPLSPNVRYPTEPFAYTPGKLLPGYRCPSMDEYGHSGTRPDY